MADPVRGLSEVTLRGYASVREAAQAIFSLIHEMIGMRIAVITRVDLPNNTLTVLEAFDRTGLGVQSGMVLPADQMPCECVVKNAAALREFDLDAHPAFRALPLRAKLGLRSYIGVPLRKPDGSIWGTLAATDTEPLPTTDSHLHILTVLGRLAMFEFEREEQRAALAERIKMMEALEEERLHAARLETLLQTAITVTHEINNPLAVAQLRLGRLLGRCRPGDLECKDDLEAALEAAEEIRQVTARLGKVVRPVPKRYASGMQMIDLEASVNDSTTPETGVS